MRRKFWSRVYQILKKGTEIDTLFKITTYLKLSEKLEFIFKSESKSLPSQSPQACTGDGGGGKGNNECPNKSTKVKYRL